MTGGRGNQVWELENRIFTERRVKLCAVCMALVCAAILGLKIYEGRSVIGPNGKPACIDFCTIWVGGNFARSEHPARAYDDAAFAAAQAALVGPHLADEPPYHFFYPPTLLLLAYPLGLMPYYVAYAVWTIVTLALYLAAIYAILPRAVALVAALTPIVVAENLLLGQNGCLTAALIGLSLAFTQRRPILAAIPLGLLTFKPHFGLLFPLAFASAHKWRLPLAAAGASLLVAAAATVAFGFEGWAASLASPGRRTSGLSTEEGLELTLQSAFGLVRWAGAGDRAALLAHLAVAALAIAAVCLLWARPLPFSLKAAALTIGAVTVTPYVQIYDLPILSIAVAFLVRDGLSRGFLHGERVAILACFVGLFSLLRPFGLFIDLVLLALVIRRAVSYRTNAPSPAA